MRMKAKTAFVLLVSGSDSVCGGCGLACPC